MTAVDVQAGKVGYRVTVLGAGLLRMWRGWRILLPTVLLNAVIQALLLLGGPLPYATLGFVVLALVGYLVLVAFVGVTTAAMLAAATGPVRFADVLRSVRTRAAALLGWSTLLMLVTIVGLSLYVLPGLLVLALTPFLLLAVLDGKPRPLRVNFRVIGARWGRWLVTVLIVAVIVLVLWLLSALDGFFVTGAPAGLIAWLVLGLVWNWLTCAWALVYRSVESAVASTE